MEGEKKECLSKETLNLGEAVYRTLLSDVQNYPSSSDGDLTDIAHREVENMSIDEAKAFLRETGILKTEAFSPSREATGLNPSLNDFPGELDFSTRFTGIPTRAKEGHFSEPLNKLFINQNKNVIVYFKINGSFPDVTKHLSIRAVAVYTGADHLQEPVRVCYTHSRDSTGSLKSLLAEHLIRCTDQGSAYFQDPKSGRHSVITKVPARQLGTDEVSLTYKFMDLGSCSGGLNRRETAIIFTLELPGFVIGRKVVALRICTCPKRDMLSEEKRHKMIAVESTTTLPNAPPTSDGRDHPSGVFFVPAFSKETFEQLKKKGEDLEHTRPNGDLKSFHDLLDKCNNGSYTLAVSPPKKVKKITLE